jgi:cold shock CspA family protein
MSADRFLGRVKWFNNRSGYGFITVTDGERSGSDIFVHHSSIKASSEQYKYLVQGEYVEFRLASATYNSDHEFNAEDVTGVKGGQLMCETRNEVRPAQRSSGRGRGSGRGSGRGRVSGRGSERR